MGQEKLFSKNVKIGVDRGFRLCYNNDMKQQTTQTLKKKKRGS